MRVLNEARWVPEVKPVYRLYPASIRSKNWPEIVRLAVKGDIEAAKALAAEGEKRSLSIRAENLIARRLRVLSPEKFALRNGSGSELKALFKVFTERVERIVKAKADGVSSIQKVSDAIHEAIVDLRRQMNVLVRGTLWSAVLMGLRHMGEAAKPVFRANQESFARELADIGEFENPSVQALLEASARVSGKIPGGSRSSDPNLNSDKWKRVADKIYGDVAKSSLRGLSVSERIWDLTSRTEQDLKRSIASDIAAGKSANDIADRVSKHIFVKGVDDNYTAGRGIYKSPLANALRLSRTELSRAYTKAQTSWSKDKGWLTGLRLTLSDAHDKEDICDKYAGDVFTPDEFEALVPLHPYCQCVGTFVIDEKYLSDPTEEAA